MHHDLLPWIYSLSRLLQPPLFFFFSFHFPFSFSSIWQIRFLILVPAEGNKELCCRSNDLICPLMKYCRQLYHPLATRRLGGPDIQPGALSWPIASLNLALLPGCGSTSLASWPGSRPPHQSLGCSDLLAHASLRETYKPCRKRKRNAGKKAQSVVIQNII